MATQRSAEEAKQHHIDQMGDALGSVYHALWNELAWLYAKWGEYVVLFGTKSSRVELLNQAAGFFFRIIQDSLWEDVLLHIARLTDSPKSAGKENLTIRRVLNLIEDETTRKRIEELVNLSIEKANFCRDWRNRHIAHKDLNLALKNGAEPLEFASREKVKEALSAISDVLNAISNRYMDSTTEFEGIGNVNNAESLLYVLEDGIRADEERRNRLQKGEYSADDYKRRSL